VFLFLRVRDVHRSFCFKFLATTQFTMSIKMNKIAFLRVFLT